MTSDEAYEYIESTGKTVIDIEGNRYRIVNDELLVQYVDYPKPITVHPTTFRRCNDEYYIYEPKADFYICVDIESKTILPRMHRKEGVPSGACVIEATRTNMVI